MFFISKTLIKTVDQLHMAVAGTYMFDLVIAVCFIVVLIASAYLIPWQGGKNDTSGAKRRYWFFIFMFLTLICSLAFNYFCYMKNIAVPTFKMDYMLHLVLGALVASAVYGGVLFLTIKMQKNYNKLASIFKQKK